MYKMKMGVLGLVLLFTAAAQAQSFCSAIFSKNSKTETPNIFNIKAGNVLKFDPMDLEVREVVKAKEAYLAMVEADPRARMLWTKDYPTTPQEQLLWIISYLKHSGKEIFQGPFYSTSVNDNRAVKFAYVRAVMSAEKIWVSSALNNTFEAYALQKSLEIMYSKEFNSEVLDPQAVLKAPFPQGNDLQIMPEQIKWVLRINAVAGWQLHTVKAFSENAFLLPYYFYYVTGLLAKYHHNTQELPMLTDRFPITVNKEPRTYSLSTPAGLMPKKGWPTIFIFHGITGHSVPEQVYADAIQYAHAEGFQVVLAVGSPQLKSAMEFTGQGALGWSPTTQKNVEYIRAVIGELQAQGKIDLQNIFGIGHSNGGLFLNEVLTTAPGLFNAVEITDQAHQINPLTSHLEFFKTHLK